MTSTSHVKIDHLLSFSNDEQKEEFEKIVNTSSNARRYKKKLIQRAYERIEAGLKSVSELSNETVKEFQLEKYAVHSSVNHLNRTLLEERSQPVFDCGQFGYSHICPNCKKSVFAHAPCGNDKHCPICSRFTAMRRMISIYNDLVLFDTSDTDEMSFRCGYPTLTYPKKHLEKTFQGFSKEESYQKMFEHANTWKRENFDKRRKGKLQNRVACLIAPHSWHTKTPLSPDNHYHIHMIIPEFVFSPIIEKSQVPVTKNIILKEGGKTKTIERRSREVVGYSKPRIIRFHKSPEELKKMRDSWAKTIGYDGEVNIHWEYSNSRKKFVHYLKYLLRGYIQDLNKNLLKVDKEKPLFFSKDQKKTALYHSNFKTGFKRIRWYGFLSNSQRKGILNHFVNELIRGIYSQLEQIRRVCPECFCEVGSDKPKLCDYDSETMLRIIHVTPLMLEMQNQKSEKHVFDSRAKIKKGVEKWLKN